MRKVAQFPRIWCLLLVALLLAGCARKDVNMLMSQAYTSAHMGDLSRAQELTAECLKQNAAYMQARLLNNYCRFCRQDSEGDRKQALYDLSKCTILEPENFDCWYFYGWALAQSGQTQQAIVPLEKALALLPPKGGPRPKVQLLLGRCYTENNLQDKALAILQPLQIRDPYRNWPELYNSLGMMALRRKQSAQAVRFLQEGLRHDPGNEVLLRNLAVVHDVYMDSPAEACNYYRQCLKRTIDRGDKEEAQQLTRRLMQVSRRVKK